MRNINIVVKDNLDKSHSLKHLLEGMPFNSEEYRLTYQDINETDLPLEHVAVQEIGEGITLYYHFDEQLDEKEDGAKLLEFANSHKKLVREKLATEPQFQSRLKSNVTTAIDALTEEAAPLVETVKQEVKPAFKAVYDNIVARFKGKQYQPSLFAAADRKDYYNKQARNELIAGVTLGLLCIPVALFLPTAVTAILAVAAIALIGAAIYHKTKANQVENVEKYEPIPQM